jgi:hypothetical protein
MRERLCYQWIAHLHDGMTAIFNFLFHLRKYPELLGRRFWCFGRNGVIPKPCDSIIPEGKADSGRGALRLVDNCWIPTELFIFKKFDLPVTGDWF